MKKIVLLLFVSIFYWGDCLHAQTQNALSFDNVDDYVTTGAASALISGSTQLTLSLWVNPANANISFPDYDGFAGIRNNTDADFYIVQHGNGLIEARFRNSAGTAHDIVFNGLIINSWQHLVFTYNESMLRLYHNSVLVGSTPATGSITNGSQAFYIGGMMYGAVNYYMKGEIDEVGLWTRAITQSEIDCLYSGGLNPNSPNLVLAYNFNQGIAGANNSGINTLNPIAGSLSGTLNNFALNGATSNWVTGVNAGATINATICSGQSYQFGTQTLTQPGTYSATFASSTGCDSTVFLNLTVTPLNTSLAVTGITIYAMLSGATYQWVNCNTGFSWVSGAINQSFTPTANGSYAVIISDGSCTDTSGCIPITTVGADGIQPAGMLNVFPNPVNDQLVIEVGKTVGSLHICIRDLSGRIIRENQFMNTDQCSLETSKLSPGSYFVEISYDGITQTRRIVKE